MFVIVALSATVQFTVALMNAESVTLDGKPPANVTVTIFPVTEIVPPTGPVKLLETYVSDDGSVSFRTTDVPALAPEFVRLIEYATFVPVTGFDGVAAPLRTMSAPAPELTCNVASLVVAEPQTFENTA
jgi:hypothetical protein